MADDFYLELARLNNRSLFPLPSSLFPLPSSRFPLPASRFPLPASLKSKEVTDLAEESVSGPSQILEPEFPRFFQRRSITEIDQRAGDRSVAEKPVRRELVADFAGVNYAVDQDWTAVSIAQCSPRPGGVLTDQSQENWWTDLVFDLHARNRFRRKARAVQLPVDGKTREL